ncbi:hypothetical protein OQJ68_10770 [Microbulbifer thermotolerans]|uniref:Uncharacterized protein n=1 Tax=Microbulbifer thermotolerans TaxID=252514 RepID=A0AB35HYZ3_MICTH|nr:hypothetical protein [Microbulbifer thermotolerans]MCX2802268.1 hypothetical protein [Microbulbifer thermotolerans]
MRILNLTQHCATPDQLAAGVIDLPEEFRQELLELLTFEQLPDADELKRRAWRVVCLADHYVGAAAMIGGAPFFMAPLESALRRAGWRVLYAFSRRESVEETQPDGSVRKTNVFRHVGFVEASDPTPRATA